MEVYIRDSMNRLSDVQDFIEKNYSYIVRGNESKGEGADFALESLNRKVDVLFTRSSIR